MSVPLNVRDGVRQFAGEFDRRYLRSHAAGSGLGLWMLYALTAEQVVAGGADIDGVFPNMIGAPAGSDVAGFVRDMIRHPHPAVAAALALWDRPEATTPMFRRWQDEMSDIAEVGRLPSQPEADRWVAERTNGMIDRFPLDVTDPLMTVVLASVLAAQVEWQHRFTPTDVGELAGPFASLVDDAMESTEHQCCLFDDVVAGLCAAHRVDSTDGLAVFSVIAANPDCTPRVVFDAAHEATRNLVDGFRPAHDISRTIATGVHGPISVQELQGVGGDRWRTVMAPWSATSDHDLAGDPPLKIITRLGDRWVQPQWLPVSVKARQSAKVEYRADGFDAAAVTAIGMLRSAALPPRSTIRETTVRFQHPYAVIAYTLPTGDGGRTDRWAGLPVFSAWVDHTT